MVKILHTSDWHLGRTLYGRKRYEEFEAFLDWMLQTLKTEQVEVLLVAGDIFDTTTPGNHAQSLYYDFLVRVPCRHVILTAGNHDSASFLNAPRGLLRRMGIHVVGEPSGEEDEVIVLADQENRPELIVCAVPYLKDRDLRVVETGETPEEKGEKLLDGLRKHYGEILQHALAKRRELPHDVPVVTMGHLFTAGGRTNDGDGVRELSIGSLTHVPVSVLDTATDYLALGHLHLPQKVAGSEMKRYSGSPLPMSLEEASQKKSVCLVEFAESGHSVRLLEVPVFQAMASLRGDWNQIAEGLIKLAASPKPVWAEVIYEGDEILSGLRERIGEITADTPIEVLRVKNNRILDAALSQTAETETLAELGTDEVFKRLLTMYNVPEEQQGGLFQTYHEAVRLYHEKEPE
jgi:exonuclease SbcD